MIIIQRTKFWQHAWFAALVGGVAVGGLVWWVQSHPERDATNVVTASGAQGRLEGSSGAPLTGQFVPTSLPDGRPSDFTSEEWRALKDAAAQSPNPAAELERMVTYLRFQRGFAQWQALKDSPDVAQRRAVARQLLTDLPQRLANAEVTGGEAEMISAALISDIEPDEAARRQHMESYRATLTSAMPQPDKAQTERESRQLAEYKRREAAIVAEWQARPSNMRDQAALEQALEDARRTVYRTETR